MVVRGTPPDSLFTLDTLLNLDGEVRPEMAAADNASYSDMAFGPYKMLGFRFAPRFRDLSDQRFWRADLPDREAPVVAEARGAGGGRPQQGEPQADRHALAGHAPRRRVAPHEPRPCLRPAADVRPRGSPKLRSAPRSPSTARIDKTMHLLALVDPVDDTYRRLMNRQLTVQESRHRLARSICHGGRGQIRQAYREGQEDQLAALGLVLNAVVLWNTRYLDAAIAQLRAEGQGVKGEDVARLSPLKDRHINFLGR